MRMIQWTTDPSTCGEIMEVTGQPPCCDCIDCDCSNEQDLWVTDHNDKALCMNVGDWVIVHDDGRIFVIREDVIA